MLFNIHCLQDNHYKHDLHNLSTYPNFHVLLTKKQASPRWHPSTVPQKGRKSRIGITRSLRFLPDTYVSHFVFLSSSVRRYHWLQIKRQVLLHSFLPCHTEYATASVLSGLQHSSTCGPVLLFQTEGSVHQMHVGRFFLLLFYWMASRNSPAVEPKYKHQE